MKKQSVKLIPAKDEFPELQSIAVEIANHTCKEVNNFYLDSPARQKEAKKARYPRQCILELLISELEKRV